MNAIGFYPRVRVDAAPVAAAGSAGGVLLTRTVRAAGLDIKDVMTDIIENKF